MPKTKSIGRVERTLAKEGRWCALLAALALLAAVRGAHAQPNCPPRYEAQVIFPSGCGLPVTARGSSINDLGQAVGSYTCGLSLDYPWLWTGGPTFTPMRRPPESDQAWAAGINLVLGSDGIGQVSGDAAFETGWNACLYSDGQWTRLSPLPGHNWCQAFAINSQSILVGFSNNSGTGIPPRRAVRWLPGQIMPEALFDEVAYASDISESGAITGWMNADPNEYRAFLWEDGELTVLPPVPGAYTSQGYAINNHNEIVGIGRYKTSQPPFWAYKGFHWRDGTMTVLPTLPGEASAASHGISDDGVMIGYTKPGNIPCIWYKGDPYIIYYQVVNNTDLYAILPAAISANGHITGIVHYIPHDYRAYPIVLTPLPPVSGDVTCDRIVNVNDLLSVINTWGPCGASGCAADLNTDGIVNHHDLLMVIANWSGT